MDKSDKKPEEGEIIDAEFKVEDISDTEKKSEPVKDSEPIESFPYEEKRKLEDFQPQQRWSKDRITRRKERLKKIEDLVALAIENQEAFKQLAPEEIGTGEREVIREGLKIQFEAVRGKEHMQDYSSLMAAKDPKEIDKIAGSLLDNGIDLAEKGISSSLLVEYPLSVVNYVDEHDLLDRDLIKKTQSLNYSTRLAKVARLVNNFELKKDDVKQIVDAHETAVKEMTASEKNPIEKAKRKKQLRTGGMLIRDYLGLYEQAVKKFGNSPDHEDFYDLTVDLLELKQDTQKALEEKESLEEKLQDNYSESEDAKRQLLLNIFKNQIDRRRLNLLYEGSLQNINSLEQKNDEYLSLLRQKESRIGNLEYRVQESTKSISSLKTILEKRTEQYQEQSDKAERLAGELEAAKSNVSEQEEIYKQEQVRVEELREKIISERAISSEAAEKLEHRVHAAKGRLGGLTRSLNFNKRKVESLTEDYKAANAEAVEQEELYKQEQTIVEELRGLVTSNNDNISKLKEDLTKTAGERNSYKIKIEATERELKSAADKAAEQEEFYNQEKEISNRLVKEATSARKKIAEQEELYKQEQVRVNRLISSKTGLELQIEMYDKEKTALTTDLKDADDKRNKLLKQIKNGEVSSAGLTSKLKTAEEKIIRIKKEYDNLNKQYQGGGNLRDYLNKTISSHEKSIKRIQEQTDCMLNKVIDSYESLSQELNKFKNRKSAEINYDRIKEILEGAVQDSVPEAPQYDDSELRNMLDKYVRQSTKIINLVENAKGMVAMYARQNTELSNLLAEAIRQNNQTPPAQPAVQQYDDTAINRRLDGIENVLRQNNQTPAQPAVQPNDDSELQRELRQGLGNLAERLNQMEQNMANYQNTAQPHQQPPQAEQGGQGGAGEPPQQLPQGGNQPGNNTQPSQPEQGNTQPQPGNDQPQTTQSQRDDNVIPFEQGRENHVNGQGIQNYYDAKTKSTRLARGVERMIREAYLKAEESLISDNENGIDLSLLKNDNDRIEFENTLYNHFLDKAKTVYTDTDDMFIESDIMYALVGFDRSFTKALIDQTKDKLEFNVYYENILKAAKNKLERTARLPSTCLNESHRNDVVRYTGLENRVDSEQLDIEDMVELLDQYKELGEIPSKLIEEKPYFRAQQQNAA